MIVVNLLDTNFGEKLVALIIAQEKRVEAVAMAADQSIAAPLAKLHHRQKRCTQVHPSSTALLEIIEIRTIFDSEASIRRNHVVCLDHEQARIDRFDRVPNPIVVSINVESKKIDFAATSAFAEQLVDVLARDPRGCE